MVGGSRDDLLGQVIEMIRRFLWLGILVGVCLGSVQAAPKKVSDERLRALVEQLGDDSYRVRTRATAELKQIGPPAKPHLVAALDDDDLEVRTRAWDILLAVARTQHGDKPRYIGIQLEQGTLKVVRVLDGSPASRAGVKPGDVVVSINGRDIADFESLVEAVQVFDRIKLVVDRSTDGKTERMTLNVTVVDGNKVFRPKEAEMPPPMPPFPD